MKSAILSHSMAVIILGYFAYSSQSLAGIYKRICLDSLNSNEHKNSLFPLTKSDDFFKYLDIFFIFYSILLFFFLIFCQLIND